VIPQPDLTGAAVDTGGDVQSPVSEGVDLAVGHNRLVGELDEFDQNTKSVAA